MTFRTGGGLLFQRIRDRGQGKLELRRDLAQTHSLCSKLTHLVPMKDPFRPSAMLSRPLRLFDAGTHTLHDDGAFELSYRPKDLHREGGYRVLVPGIDALTGTHKPDTQRLERTDAVEASLATSAPNGRA